MATLIVEDKHWVLRNETGTELWRSRNGCSQQNQDAILKILYGNRAKTLTMKIQDGLNVEQIAEIVTLLAKMSGQENKPIFAGIEVFLQ